MSQTPNQGGPPEGGDPQEGSWQPPAEPDPQRPQSGPDPQSPMPGSQQPGWQQPPGGTGALRHAIANFLEPGQQLLTSSFFWGPYKTLADEADRGLATFRMFTEDGALVVSECAIWEWGCAEGY